MGIIKKDAVKKRPKRIWSGKRGSNSRPRPWQGRALPTELFPRSDMLSKTGRIIQMFLDHASKIF